MKEKIIIGIDIDNTINNFSELFTIYFERVTGYKMKIEDIDDWNLKTVINRMYKGKVNGDIALEIYQREDFLLDLKLLKNTKEVLEELSKDERVEVKFVTAMAKKELHLIRDKWIERELGDINIEVVYENEKEKIKMDYLIDDAEHNLDAVSKIIGDCNCICISHIYNENVKYPRVENLKDAIEYIYKKELLNNKRSA